jgi:chemotaxis response regulator CheB
LQRTRVLLADMSRILSDIVKDALARQADMEVVGDVRDAMRWSEVVSDAHVDVLVIGRELVDEDLERLRKRCAVAVLALTNDGRGAMRYRLHAEPVQVEDDDTDVSPELIVEAIRAEARRLGS